MSALWAFIGGIAGATGAFVVGFFRFLAYLPGYLALFITLFITFLPVFLILTVVGIVGVIFAQNQGEVFVQLDNILEVNQEAFETFRENVNSVLEAIWPLLYINNAFWDFAGEAFYALVNLLGCSPGQRCTAIEDILEFLRHIAPFFEQIGIIVYSAFRELLLSTTTSIPQVPFSYNDTRDQLLVTRDAIFGNKSDAIHALNAGDDFVTATVSFFQLIANPEIILVLFELVEFFIQEGIDWALKLAKLFLSDIGSAFQWLLDNGIWADAISPILNGIFDIQRSVDLWDAFIFGFFPGLLNTIAGFFSNIYAIVSAAIANEIGTIIGAIEGAVESDVINFIVNNIGSIISTGGLPAGRRSARYDWTQLDAQESARLTRDSLERLFPETAGPGATITCNQSLASCVCFLNSNCTSNILPACAQMVNAFDSYQYAMYSTLQKMVFQACTLIVEWEISWNATYNSNVPFTVIVRQTHAALQETVTRLERWNENARSRWKGLRGSRNAEPPSETSGNRTESRRSSRNEESVSPAQLKKEERERRVNQVYKIAERPEWKKIVHHWRKFSDRATQYSRVKHANETVAAERERKPPKLATRGRFATIISFLVTNRPNRAQLGEFLVKEDIIRDFSAASDRQKKHAEQKAAKRLARKHGTTSPPIARVGPRSILTDIFDPSSITGTITLPSINFGSLLEGIYNYIFHCPNNPPLVYCLPYIYPTPSIPDINLLIDWPAAFAPPHDCSAFQSVGAEISYGIKLLTNGPVLQVSSIIKPFIVIVSVIPGFGFLYNVFIAGTTFPGGVAPADGNFCFFVDLGYVILALDIVFFVLLVLATFGGPLIALVIIYAVCLIYVTILFVFSLFLFFVSTFLALIVNFCFNCGSVSLTQRVTNLETKVAELQENTAVKASTSGDMFATAMRSNGYMIPPLLFAFGVRSKNYAGHTKKTKRL
jgi:hypothetical protein